LEDYLAQSRGSAQYALMSAASRIVRTFVPTWIKNWRVYQTARHLVKSYDSIYDETYYDVDVEGPALKSAGVMASSIVEHFRPTTVIDVGCGTGALLDAFKRLNCEVHGLEYSEAGRAYCKKRGIAVRKFNIEKDSLDDEQYDLAVSFEVAEHLPASMANRYVGLLCKLSPLVVMSAATRGQGGLDHINEQPHSYWIRKFDANRYSFDQDTSGKFSRTWKESGAKYWYYDNVMVFVRR
jgi:2-polyprenyl-3-methyl-5-hydroxy-6-metoxy-1,4-benzoquinol methylase